jgi:membrane protease YdiL (CAAX protease family)
MKKNFIPSFLLCFFLVIFALRLVDSFCLRTDQGPIGELFAHKLADFALLIAAVRFLRLKWDTDIGFKWDQLLRGILTGLAIGGPAYLTAYIAEMGIAIIQGKPPSLQFYVTSYNVTGNTLLDSGVLLLLICVAGNIINVTVENSIFSGLMISAAEKRYSFFIANGFFSSFLFGLWHSVMPLRNFIDRSQSLSGAAMAALMLFGSSFLFSVQLGMQFKQASSLWDGMVVHFINNVSVNLIHVVFSDGTESAPTMRIAIAQTIIFIVVLVRYFTWKKTTKYAAGGEPGAGALDASLQIR